MEAPELQKASVEFAPQGVLFLGVFLISTEAEIRRFAENHGITFPVGKDTGIARALGVRGIPETVFIAPDGRIVGRRRGSITYDQIAGGIEQILTDLWPARNGPEPIPP